MSSEIRREKNNIQRMFNSVIKKAYQVQEKEHAGEKIDGREVWQTIEKEIIHHIPAGLLYNDSLKPIYGVMNELIEKYHLDDKKKPDHFLLQLKNLVVAKSEWNIYLNRVLQIAYNIGQLCYFILKTDKIPADIIKFFNDNNLNRLSSYVSTENQLVIDRYLEENKL